MLFSLFFVLWYFVNLKILRLLAHLSWNLRHWSRNRVWQVLLGETADSTLRGFLTGSTLTFYCLGIVIIYALGACFTWNIVALCGAVLPITALIALILIPESPAWLVRRRKPDKARKALLWLRGGNVQQVSAIRIRRHRYLCKIVTESKVYRKSKKFVLSR